MNKYKFYINKRLITNNTKPFLIAEVAQSHSGNIKNVYNYINKLSKIGIDAIKFQTHIAEHESTYDEKFRLKIKKYKNRYSYWKSMEFTPSQWLNIKRYCDKKKIIFLSSVFSVQSIKLLSKIGLKTWKLGSGELNSFDMFEYLKFYKKKNPILISTGLMDNSKIKSVYNYFIKTNPLCIMHCVSKYPSKYSELGFNIINDLKKKYKCIIGYSDHSGSVFSILYALSMSIPIIEFHIKFNENKNNIDGTSSININNVKFIKEANDIFYILKNTKINKNVSNQHQKKMIKLFGKILAFKKDMFKGQKINKNDFTLKKPGTGIQHSVIKKLIGKKISRNLSRKRLIKYKDFK